ncbi:S8 family serine peptidase [Oceanospirillum sp.]|uniref:S8 family serine peptidase n=1 Tax=Oceanospirillum sp. TaxID=2021254 RepID=UPI003A91BB2D
MQKLATLTCLLTLYACGEGSDEINTSSSKGAGDTSICSSVYYSTQAANTSGLDPLLNAQWHLLNNRNNPGAAGQDINLPQTLWNEATGAGVKIAVIDGSIDYSHPDLQPNLDLDNSCQFGVPLSGGHATSVAGLISAVRNNALGGSGAAPESKIQGFNTLDADPTVTVWETSLSATSERNRDIDIFNMSLGYGIETTPIDYDTNIASMIKSGTESGRKGLGALYFKAAGNNFSDPACSTENYHSELLPCQGSALDPDNNIPYLMVVSSLNANGTKASYSSSGANILFSSPGGDSRTGLVTTNDISLATGLTDIRGFKGYTRAFSGTSAATPLVSGVAALVLEANSDLGWRDVRDILIRTADKVDTGDNSGEDNYIVIGNDGSILKTRTPSTNLIIENAWQTNAAGLSYHNHYGFGRINAANALNSAKSYSANLPDLISVSTENGSGGVIPNSSNNPLSSSLSISSELSTVESVQLKLELSHPYASDLMVKLIAPSGTESIVMTPRNALNAEINHYEFTLLSQMFYGETAAGSWQLQVYDTQADAFATGTLHSWSLTILGH